MKNFSLVALLFMAYSTSASPLKAVMTERCGWFHSCASVNSPATLIVKAAGLNAQKQLEIVPDVGLIRPINGEIKVLPRKTTVYKLIVDGKVVAKCKVRRKL